jgi:hypothetical protein
MYIASPLSGNGTVVPGIRLHRQQPVTIPFIVTSNINKTVDQNEQDGAAATL